MKCVLIKNEFPIGVYCGPQFDGENNIAVEKFVKYVKKCNVNFVVRGNGYETEEGKKLVELYDEYGVGYFVEDGRIKEIDKEGYSAEKFAEYLSEYKDRACYLGPYFADEPNMAEIERYEKYHSLFASSKVEGIPYINLLPSCGDGMIHPGDPDFTFYDYAESYIKRCGLKLLSYDHYLMCTGLLNRGITYSYTYIKDLNSASVLSKKYDIPFWAFAACGGQWQAPVVAEDHYPNKRQFEYSVFIALVFGAKGIQYFPFMQPSFFYSAAGSYKVNGMIGYNGKPNKWYYYAKKINAFIRANSDVFINATHEKVMFLGGSAVAFDEGGVILPDNKYGKISFAESEHAVVGIFECKGKKCYYILNNSFTEKCHVSIRFTEKTDFYVTGFNKNEDRLLHGEDGKVISLNLYAAGFAVLLER